MRLTITLARALPLPPMEIGGEAVTFLPVTATSDIPDGTRVHITTSLDPLDGAAIAAMPDSIGLIANIGVGVDNIDLAAAAGRGIAVSNTPVVTEDTADLAFALILAATRRVGEGERYLRGGSWTASGVAPPLGGRVHGKTLGLVGFGAIGQAVARRARGFDMPVRYWNRTRKPEAEKTLGAIYDADLGSLLANSDVISVHTALTPETQGLIGAKALATARAGVVLINTARGGIVDADALCDALETGQLAAAGLAVFDGEPGVNPRLLSREEVVLTPHIGSATSACRMDMARHVLMNVVSFVETGKVPDAVTA